MNPSFFNEVLKLINMNLLDPVYIHWLLVAGFPFTALSKLCLKVSWLLYLPFNMFINPQSDAEASCNRSANLVLIRQSLGEGMKMYFSASVISKCEQQEGLWNAFSLITERVIIAETW